jgi:hypothetical protein
VEKVREKLAANKQGSHRFYMERSDLKKLEEAEGKEKYRVEVSNRFASLGNLNAWEPTRKYKKTEP